MRWLPLLALSACLGPVYEPPLPSYHNPLDLLDGGVLHRPDAGQSSDGGLPPGATVSTGSVDGQGFVLSSAIYQVLGGGDAGQPRALIFLSDAPHLCAQLQDAGALATPWNLLRFHVAGDVPAAYPVAALLAPAGAVAEFDWEAGPDAGGGFGFETSQGGEVNLEAVDPGNAQPAIGSYTADFGDAGSVTGRFTASPCPAVPPAPGP